MANTRDLPVFLESEGLISREQRQRLEDILFCRIVSVHHELRIMMYLGVTMFSTGIAMLLYRNIATIDHKAILISVIAMTLGCLFYATKKSPGFSFGEVAAPTPIFDYIVLLGCLLFMTTLGYAQFQFQLFEAQPERGALVAGICYLIGAYYFDNRGVLTLGLCSLASYFGISLGWNVQAMSEFSVEKFYLVAMAFGSLMTAVGLLFHSYGVKRHFTFSYINFCGTLFQVGAITALFSGDFRYAFAVLIGCISFVVLAFRLNSFALVLHAYIFAFIAISYLLARVSRGLATSSSLFIFTFYVMISGGAFIWFVQRFRKFFKGR